MPEKSIILNRTNHIINTGELTIDKFIYYTRRTPWLWIKVQTKRVDQERHTHNPCRWGSADGEKENIPEGFSFKKKCTHQLGCSPLPSFSSVCVFLSGISLCNPVSSLLPFIRPQTVGAKAVSQRSDSSAVRHAWGLQRCLFLSNSLVLPGQPPKQFYNLAAGTKLPFTLLLARFLRQFISHLCL